MRRVRCYVCRMKRAGLAFFQGTGAPVSFRPFIRELDISLQKQAALTFLVNTLKKGFHKIEVKSSTPGVRVHLSFRVREE